MELSLTKKIGCVIPADRQTEEYIAGLKLGSLIHGNFAKMRDPVKHKKFFALLNLAFDWWEPGEVSNRHGTPQKNFERFRKDVTILAGYYEVDIRLDGSTRIEAKSISFSNMDDAEFERLYSAVIDVILKRITSRFSYEEIDDAVMRILDFA